MPRWKSVLNGKSGLKKKSNNSPRDLSSTAKAAASLDPPPQSHDVTTPTYRASQSLFGVSHYPILCNLALYLLKIEMVRLSQTNSLLRRFFLPRVWKHHVHLFKETRSVAPSHARELIKWACTRTYEKYANHYNISFLVLDFNLNELHGLFAQGATRYERVWNELKDFKRLERFNLMNADWNLYIAAMTVFPHLPELTSFSFLSGVAWLANYGEPPLPENLERFENIKAIEIYPSEYEIEERDFGMEAVMLEFLLNKCQPSIHHLSFPGEYLPYILDPGKGKSYPSLRCVCLRGYYRYRVLPGERNILHYLQKLNLTHLDVQLDPLQPDSDITLDPTSSTIYESLPSLEALIFFEPTLRHPIFSRLPPSLTRLEIHPFNFPYTTSCRKLSEIVSWFKTVACPNVMTFKIGFQIDDDSDVRLFVLDIGKAFSYIDLLLIHVVGPTHIEAQQVSQAIAMGLRDAGATLTRLHLMLEISNMPILSTPRKWRIVNEFCLIPCVPLLRSVREIITLTRLVGGPGFNVFDTKVDADGESKIIKRQFLIFHEEGHYWRRVEDWRREKLAIMLKVAKSKKIPDWDLINEIFDA